MEMVSTPRSFRLGSELYAQKFLNQIQSEYSAEQIYKMALERKKYLHEQMYATTKTLWKDYFFNTPMPQDNLVAIKMMIDTLSDIPPRLIGYPIIYIVCGKLYLMAFCYQLIHQPAHSRKVGAVVVS